MFEPGTMKLSKTVVCDVCKHRRDCKLAAERIHFEMKWEDVAQCVETSEADKRLAMNLIKKSNK